MQGSVGDHIGDWFSEGWRLFAEQWQGWVLNALIFFGILWVPLAPLIVVTYLAFFGILIAGQGSDAAAMGGVAFIAAMVFILVAALVVATSFFSAGLHSSALKQLRGERVQVSDLFSGGRYLGRFIGFSILISLLTFVGFLMCIIPSLIVSGLFIFTGFIIVDKDCGVIEAMRASYDRCKHAVLWYTLLGIILALISRAGAYVLYVGILVTFPLAFTIRAVAYRDSFDIPGMRVLRNDKRAYPPPYDSAPPSFRDSSRAGDDAPWVPQGRPLGSPPGPDGETIPCPSCGRQIPKIARFCSECGSPVTDRPWTR
jgi:hypothetical protein